MKNRGLVGGLYDSLSYLYESVIQDYVESVYTDVIEGYTIATIKVKFLQVSQSDSAL